VNVFELLGYVGGVFNIVTYSMRTMIPLRIMAIVSNCIFIVYASLDGVYPVLILHVVLLPLNALRLREMVRLVEHIRHATHGDPRMDWLKPFMSRRTCRKGEVLFKAGDHADRMFIVLSGGFRLKELDKAIDIGDVVGELGFLAPENRRGQTLECTADGDLLTISYDELRQLYFRNPEFGFYFLRLTTRRLFENLAHRDAEVAGLRQQLRAASSDPVR
jgi:CRP-like cAMP-binding protein